MALAATVEFDPARGDRMLFVGDLVNRGPHNADVLRWMMAQGAAVDAVLGNHDLHLLARARGLSDAKRRDTLGDVLTAPPPERAALLDWLRHRPLLLEVALPDRGARHFVQDPDRGARHFVQDPDRGARHFVQDPGTSAGHLVHAGWPPGMTPEEAQTEAAALEARLRGGGVDGLLRELRGHPVPWSRVRDGTDTRARQRAALQAFVYLRTCQPDGTPDPTYSGALSDRPPGHVAWFDFDAGPRQGTTIFFGHWAALGLYAGRGVLCLDTGAVWGRGLTALRLEDGRLFTVDTVDALAHGREAGSGGPGP
ncbi:metallophosphoesterase [Myxococcota bacterium]|nr:metallophosphoesterase [Myxococcota bacterium]